MVFYLKINRDENYTYRNMQRWVDVVSLSADNQAYIICDSSKVKEKANNKVDFGVLRHEWITSDRDDEELKYIVDHVIQENWKNAAYAHLTTFAHAKKEGYDEYWNIDADDTFFCLSTTRTEELLKEAARYANEMRIDIFSLDMWRSREPGLHWTFGITYTRTMTDWMAVMKKGCNNDEDERNRFMCLCKNVDTFFTYLGEFTEVKTGSFYVENLRFVHYSDDLLMRPIDSGLFHFHEKTITFPIMYYAIGDKELGRIPIYKDVIGLDIGISDEETTIAIMERGYNLKRAKWTKAMYHDRDLGMSDDEIKEDIVKNYY